MPRVAAFTIAQFEPVFLPRWVRHYSSLGLPPSDLFVLHHGLPPEARGRSALEWPAGGRPLDIADWTAALDALRLAGVPVLDVHRAVAFDHDWLRATVARFQAFLLQSYDWVLFAECDELVVPWDAASGRMVPLAEYVEAHLGTYLAARCTGYDVVHREGEPDLAPGDPFLAIRSTWGRSEDASKTLLARAPLRWGRGFHDVEGVAGVARPDLLLVHLHKADARLALAKSRESASRRWSEADVARGSGAQNRITDAAALRAFLDSGWDSHGRPIIFSAIPEAIRALPI